MNRAHIKAIKTGRCIYRGEEYKAEKIAENITGVYRHAIFTAWNGEICDEWCYLGSYSDAEVATIKAN